VVEGVHKPRDAHRPRPTELARLRLLVGGWWVGTTMRCRPQSRADGNVRTRDFLRKQGMWPRLIPAASNDKAVGCDGFSYLTKPCINGVDLCTEEKLMLVSQANHHAHPNPGGGQWPQRNRDRACRGSETGPCRGSCDGVQGTLPQRPAGSLQANAWGCRVRAATSPRTTDAPRSGAQADMSKHRTWATTSIIAPS
jgi:hypothetical protein